MSTTIDNAYFAAPISNTDPQKIMSLYAVFKFIQDTELRSVTEGIRHGLKDKNTDLPYITSSGVFQRRANDQLVTYSGVICMDLDDVNIHFKHILMSDHFLNPAMVFVSPSGNGLKLFIRIQGSTAGNHRKYWLAIEKYLLTHYCLQPDRSCKDISRPCYLCHDPEVLFSPTGSVSASDLLDRFSGEEPSPPEPMPEKELAALHKDCKYRHLGPAKKHLDHTDEVNLFNSSPHLFVYAKGLLQQHGWRQNGIFFLRPGKKGSRNDKSAVFTIPPGYSIPVFYNFSSNALVFEPNKGYSPVQVISLLEFNDDFKACMTALKERFSYVLPQHDPVLKMDNPQVKIPDPDFFRVRKYKTLLEDGSKFPKRKKIVGPFLYEDTTSLLFSRTNYGKSVMAFQFAYTAATGSHFEGKTFLENQCDPMKTLVIDLELDERVHFERHGKILENPNPYLDNLKYVHEKLENNTMIGFDLLKKIEEAAIKHEAKLLVIDNISKLLPDALKPDLATMIITMLNRVRLQTKASILVIGHTTKGNPNVCVQPTDYYGSAMIQNFFNELIFLDKTLDGNFFLCHSKTKHGECYDTSVPVFSRGEHNRFGFGFTYCHISPVDQVRLPYTLDPGKQSRPRNLSEFKDEIASLMANGFSQMEIAKFCGVNQSSINRVLNKT